MRRCLIDCMEYIGYDGQLGLARKWTECASKCWAGVLARMGLSKWGSACAVAGVTHGPEVVKVLTCNLNNASVNRLRIFAGCIEAKMLKSYLKNSGSLPHIVELVDLRPEVFAWLSQRLGNSCVLRTY